MKELKDRVDDALHATKAAISEGIVPGGGMALLYASQAIDLNENYTLGAYIVKKACRKPFIQILINAGYDITEAEILASKFLEKGDKWEGYNIKEEETVNMKNAGIIDPTKVTRTALQNAASIGGLMITTECTISELPKPEKDSGHSHGNMGGMGGMGMGDMGDF